LGDSKNNHCVKKVNLDFICKKYLKKDEEKEENKKNMKNLPYILYLINIEKFSYRNILCFSPFPPQGKIVFCFIYYFGIFITDRILSTFRDEI